MARWAMRQKTIFSTVFVDLGVTNATECDFEENLSGLQRGDDEIDQFQRSAE